MTEAACPLARNQSNTRVQLRLEPPGARFSFRLKNEHQTRQQTGGWPEILRPHGNVTPPALILLKIHP